MKLTMGIEEIARFAGGLRYSGDGLVPVVVSDAKGGEVLMLAYASREAVEKTLSTGEAYFFSRSRNSLWKKGETSGNVMEVASVEQDCDSDALLYRVVVKGEGKACHTGKRSCFGIGNSKAEEDFSIRMLDETIGSRAREPPKDSYTSRLLSSPDLAREKIREESEELIEALSCKGKEEVVWEACDLIYHVLVAARPAGVSLCDIEKELGRRNKEKGKGSLAAEHKR